MLTLRQISTKRAVAPLIAVALLGGIVLGAQGCREAGDRSQAGEGEARPLPVATAAPVAVEAYVRRRSYSGEVRARRTAHLGFERGGRVAEVLVDEGQAVEAGAVLATVERDRIEQQRARLLAGRREAEAVLAEMRAGPRAEVVSAAREAVAELKARVDLLERKKSRREKLRAESAISHEELDEALSLLAATAARLRGAEDRLKELLEGTRTERIAAQEARLAALDAEVALLDIDLADATLHAPFAGRVLRRQVDEGTVVAAGTTVVTIVEDGVLEAWIGVPPAVAPQPAADGERTHAVRVGGRTFDATCLARLPGTDVATRTQTVVFALPPEASAVAVPGQVAELAVEERVAVSGLWVPASALTRGVRGLWAVYAAEPSAAGEGERVVRHHVEVLHSDGGRVLVRGTLTPDARLLTGNTEKITPGQRVVAVHGDE